MFSFEYAYQIFVLNNNNAFRYLRRNASFFCFPREMLFFYWNDIRKWQIRFEYTYIFRNLHSRLKLARVIIFFEIQKNTKTPFADIRNNRSWNNEILTASSRICLVRYIFSSLFFSFFSLIIFSKLHAHIYPYFKHS